MKKQTNKQTNKQAALTFFPYALLCPCCVLGANASLLHGEPADSGTPVAPLTRGNLAKHRFRDAGMDVMEVLPPTGDSAPHEPTALEKVVTEATEMAKMLEEPDGAVE